jgi:hypothetical protein
LTLNDYAASTQSFRTQFLQISDLPSSEEQLSSPEAILVVVFDTLRDDLLARVLRIVAIYVFRVAQNAVSIEQLN